MRKSSTRFGRTWCSSRSSRPESACWVRLVAGGPKGDGVPPATTNTSADFTSETWTGLTLDQAEQINCQSTNEGDIYGDGTVFGMQALGRQRRSRGELHRRDLPDHPSGPRSRLHRHRSTAKGRPGGANAASTYVIPVGAPITKDGNSLDIDWTNAATKAAKINELYDAVAASYSAFGAEPDCLGSGHCISNKLTDEFAYIWFTTVGFTMYFEFPQQSCTPERHHADPALPDPDEGPPSRTLPSSRNDAVILIRTNHFEEHCRNAKTGVFQPGQTTRPSSLCRRSAHGHQHWKNRGCY